jgi:hypothetical protein
MASVRSPLFKIGTLYAICPETFGMLLSPIGRGNVSPSKYRRIDMLKDRIQRFGTMKWGLIAALLGLPLPIILIAFLFVGGCR